MKAGNNFLHPLTNREEVPEMVVNSKKGNEKVYSSCLLTNNQIMKNKNFTI